jgi:DNA-binding PadR family transcriptional regulator
MKLTPSTYLILGLVRQGVKSGYAIKKAAEVSSRFFWPMSLAQVYPALAELEREGLVKRREDPHGARARSAYEITKDGEAALIAWLRSTRETPIQFRDEGVLRLFFADALPAEDQLALVRRLRERTHDVTTQAHSELLPIAEALEEAGTRFPAVLARLRIEVFAFIEQRAAELESELDRKSPTD